MKKISKVIRNPIFGLFFGIIISYIFYILQKDSIEITSAISSTDNITKTNISSKLKFYYDTMLVENVKSIKISIWNSGTKYIDKTDISKTYPLCFIPSDSIRILEIRTIKRTRNNLNVIPTAYFDSTNKKNQIKLEIFGDDGFEKYDGLTFYILYSSRKEILWNVDGRIKGFSRKIDIEKWDDIAKHSSYWPIIGKIFLFGFFMLMLFGYKRNDKEKWTKGDILIFILNITFVLFSILLIIIECSNYIEYKKIINLLY